MLQANGVVSRSASHAVIRWLALILLLSVALITRLPAPWRMDSTNDEMIHVNNYQDDYNKAKFLHELSAHFGKLRGLIDPRHLHYLKDVYDHSEVLPRLQFLFIRDAHPPIFPLIAELANCVGEPGLLAMRVFAMTGSLLFIWIVYLLGKEYASSTLGLWMAGLATINFTSTVYAGIARPYAFAQVAAACVLLAYLRFGKSPQASLRTFLTVALLSQATDWMLWPAIAPFVAAALWSRFGVDRSVSRILKEIWWYALASCLLLIQFAVQIANPVISNQVTLRNTANLWAAFSLAAPFAELGHAVRELTSIGAIVFVLLCAVGLICILADRNRSLIQRYALIGALVASTIVVILEPTHVRIFIVPVAVLILYAGIGISRVPMSPRSSELLLCCLLLVFLLISTIGPESPYERVFDYETKYSEVAARLAAERDSKDVWFAIPDFISNPLFLYGATAPLEIPDDAAVRVLVKDCAKNRNCYAFGRIGRMQTEWMAPERSNDYWLFPNNFVLVKVPKPL